MPVEALARPILVLAAALLLVFAAGAEAMAVGTAAGTIISNQAYVDYKDANGNAMSRVYSNTVTTTVSQVAGVNIVPPTATDAGSNSTTVAFLVQIFNTGNGPDTFDFTYQVTAGWTPTSVVFYYDANNNHQYEAGTDPQINLVNGKYPTGIVSHDDDYDVWMFVTIPAAAQAPDASSSNIKITAVSRLDAAVSDFGNYTTKVAGAVITSLKTHTPLSPKPGETVTYTITLTNSGTSNGTNVIMTDPLPANMTYIPGSITLGGAAKTDANDGDGANYNITTAGAITVSVGTINSGGGVAVISFQVSVNNGVAADSTITNQATVNYNSGPNPVTTTSNGRTLFVASSLGVNLNATVTGATGDPGDQIVQKFTITNNGNAPDTFDMTYTSSKGWTWVLWVDANGDGIPGTGGDYILTDIDGDGIPDIGPLPQNGSASLLAVTTIPPGTPDRTIDSLSVRALSDTDKVTSDTQTFTTTVTAPVLSVTKSVSPAGSQPPGTDLVYTITVTNTGSGMATAVVITDPIPANTTYKAGTLKTGQTIAGLVARTDASDGDGAYFDSTGNTVVEGATGNITMGPGGTEILQFTVTIK